METKFIKYKPEQVNLAEIYRSSTRIALDNHDVQDGTLIIGYSDGGKYLAMGYLRGMAQGKDSRKMLYEIENAIEGQEYLTCIEHPYKVCSDSLPYLAAVTDHSEKPIVGNVIKCNGELATILDGSIHVVNVYSIHELTPCFKETK